MKKEELLERYEALGSEDDFRAAKRLYERALAERPDARVVNGHGYLLECHARNELRRAVEQYERAVELDSGYDKPHFQLISARAGLQEPELPVELYSRRVADAPGDVRERRFLAHAYLRAHAYDRALAAAEAGLGLAGDDPALIALRGEARAGLRDTEGALGDWRRAAELDPDEAGPIYSTAFLLERVGRRAEAAETWRLIAEWNESRGYTLQSEWPRQQLARLSAA